MSVMLGSWIERSQRCLVTINCMQVDCQLKERRAFGAVMEGLADRDTLAAFVPSAAGQLVSSQPLTCCILPS